MELAAEWADLTDHFTLAIITRDDCVAMGRKARGLGKGELVFPGGIKWHREVGTNQGRNSIELNSSLIEAAEEARQEAGIIIPPPHLGQVGLLEILTEEGDERIVTICKGSVESEYLRDSDELIDAGWYSIDSIPYNQTPPDYQHWAPPVLHGRWVQGIFDADDSGHIVAGQLTTIDPAGASRSQNIVISD